MVEKIEMQKGFIPVFSANKVKHMKRQNGSMPERRFDKDLKKEKDKKKNQNENRSVRPGKDDVTGKTISTPEDDYIIDQSPDLKNKAANSVQGKLIDIVV